MPDERVRNFLDETGIRYIIIRHSPAFTAHETHIRGKELAKTVIAKIDGPMAMVVTAASSRVDLVRLQTITGAQDVELATEEEFGGLFPECELGVMPPFGNLYDMAVYADDLLCEDEEIAFNAGSHIDLIQMTWADFERVVGPQVVRVRTQILSAQREDEQRLRSSPDRPAQAGDRNDPTCPPDAADRSGSRPLG